MHETRCAMVASLKDFSGLRRHILVTEIFICLTGCDVHDAISRNVNKTTSTEYTYLCMYICNVIIYIVRPVAACKYDYISCENLFSTFSPTTRAIFP